MAKPGSYELWAYTRARGSTEPWTNMPLRNLEGWAELTFQEFTFTPKTASSPAYIRWKGQRNEYQIVIYER